MKRADRVNVIVCLSNVSIDKEKGHYSGIGCSACEFESGGSAIFTVLEEKASDWAKVESFGPWWSSLSVR